LQNRTLSTKVVLITRATSC